MSEKKGKWMNGKKVLVIDDDIDVRILVEKVLSHAEYQVFLAENGKEGMEILEKEDCDGALVDFSLSDYSGVDLAKSLKAKKGCSFPVIALTANTMEVIKTKYPEALEVFTAFCIKPFSLQELLALLKDKLF